MKCFKTKEEAIKYAKNIRKNGYEIVMIENVKTMVFPTSIGEEEIFRNKFESIIAGFFNEIGVDNPYDNEYIDDCIRFIGAQLEERTEEILDKYKKQTGISVLNARLNY